MTLADYSVGLFAVLNGARVFAYVPQILCLYHDKNGGSAVSITTWALFAAANVATVSYAVVVSHDWLVASVFSLNALGCTGIVVLIALKRIEHDLKDGIPILTSLLATARRDLRRIVDRLVDMRLKSAQRRLQIELWLTLPSARRFPLYRGIDPSQSPSEQQQSERKRGRDR
jgi:hypothetical protein